MPRVRRTATRGSAPVARTTFELLWGAHGGTRRGPRPTLGRDETVRAAIDLADRDGLSALTMSRVAARLGVTTMAPYRHVRDKEQLLELMVDAALAFPPAVETGGWRPNLERWARASHATFLAHPWLLDTITSRVVIGPHWAAWLDAALRALVDVPLDARAKLAVVVLLDGHVRATVQLTTGPASTRGWREAFEALLDRVAADERFDALAAVAEAGGFSPAKSRAADDPFEFGLHRVLDGLAVLLDRRGSRRSSPLGSKRPTPAPRRRPH